MAFKQQDLLVQDFKEVRIPSENFFSGNFSERDRDLAELVKRYFRGSLTGDVILPRPPSTKKAEDEQAA